MTSIHFIIYGECSVQCQGWAGPTSNAIWSCQSVDQLHFRVCNKLGGIYLDVPVGHERLSSVSPKKRIAITKDCTMSQLWATECYQSLLLHSHIVHIHPVQELQRREFCFSNINDHIRAATPCRVKPTSVQQSWEDNQMCHSDPFSAEIRNIRWVFGDTGLLRSCGNTDIPVLQ